MIGESTRTLACNTLDGAVRAQPKPARPAALEAPERTVRLVRLRATDVTYPYTRVAPKGGAALWASGPVFEWDQRFVWRIGKMAQSYRPASNSPVLDR
jgi:hypothetical protein